MSEKICLVLHCNLDGEPIHKRKLRFSVLPSHLQVAIPELASAT